jgi:hypothetical protein
MLAFQEFFRSLGAVPFLSMAVVAGKTPALRLLRG